MNFVKLAVAAIASTAVTLAISPQANATEVSACQATSDRLNFVYEDGYTGYFVYGDVFPCYTYDGYSLLTTVNGYSVLFTNGSVNINGSPYIVEYGEIYSLDSYSYGNEDYYYDEYNYNDVIDSGTYDSGYRTDYNY